ncbi:MAG: cytochrome P450 [Actinobacteria bacterium]|nr:cytochrome P450 [Actinomycetota bacterium]
MAETLEATELPLEGRGTTTPSPAGPIDAAELAGLAEPPMIQLPRAIQVLRFTMRQEQFVSRARRELGEVFRFNGVIAGRPVVVSHPDHVKSLFTAPPELVPSLTGESPLRPFVGENSVLTSQGERHMRQRKLLLPAFHGDAVARYSQMIERAAEREIARWPVGEPFQLAPRMQAITLDVIMSGIFGIEGRPKHDTPEWRLRQATKQVVTMSNWAIAQVGELMNLGHSEPVGIAKLAISILDRATYEVIADRRRADDAGDRHDILSMLLRSRADDGEALTDRELRDELVTLVLAGHETTANSLSWAWERLTRTPDAYDELYESVRGGREDAADQIEYVINEAMRSRPVVPIVGRRVQSAWRIGDFGVPAGTPVSASILLTHHREDLYPDPYAFKPRRWAGRKPGTYEWFPFGGGTRRCLGASLAMAEQRVVFDAMVKRLDIEADRPEPERARHRNVTMIPARGARVVVRARH